MTDDATSAALLAEADDLVRRGDAQGAMDRYRAALAAREDLPDAWFNLAWLQRASRRFDDALAAYAQALRFGVARPEEVHLNRAAIYADHLFRTDEAEAELRRALAISPAFVQAWLNLGNLHEDAGRREAARDAYEGALQVEPNNGRAQARLAHMEVAEGEVTKALARLEGALATSTTAADRADILFALSGALDASGRYHEAFQAAEAANWIARASTPARYDPAAQERLVDRLIGAFPTPLPSAIPADGAAPVFICGMFRSGSTITEQMLARHPRVTSGGEVEFIPALVRARLQPYPEALASMSPGDFGALRAEYLAEQAAGHSGGAAVTDKRCDNFMHIGLIKAMFPDARIVHTVRQPLDNLLSIYFLHFGEGVAYGHDLREAAHYLREQERLMAHWRRLFPGDIHEVDYDALVADPRPVMATLLDFLGLPWDDRVLAPDAGSGAVRTASAWQVRQPLHARSSGRWRHYTAELGDLVEQFA